MPTEQPTLFDLVTQPTPVARNSDPETSHAAAASITPSALRASHEAIIELMTLIGDGTDEYIVFQYDLLRNLYAWPRQSQSGIRTRRNELTNAGIITDSGRRAPTVSGRLAIVWEIATNAE